MSISRLGVVLKFGDSSLRWLNQRFDFRGSVAWRDVFGTVPIERNHLDEKYALDDTLHVWRGKLRDKFGMLPRVLDPRVAEDFQPSALRIIHQEEAHAIVHSDVASRKHLAVAFVICERQRRGADDSKKARLAAAML